MSCGGLGVVNCPCSYSVGGEDCFRGCTNGELACGGCADCQTDHGFEEFEPDELELGGEG